MSLNEYDELLTNKERDLGAAYSVIDEIATGQKQAPTNAYPNLVEASQGANKPLLEQSMFVASKRESDRWASVLDLSKKSNLPPEIIDRNFDTINKTLNTELDYASILKDHPGLSKWLQNPDNATIAKDELDPLKAIDRHANGIILRQQDSQSDVSKAFQTGWTNLKTSAIHLATTYGLISPEQSADIIAEQNKVIQSIMERRPDYVKEYEKALEAEGQDVVNAGRRFGESFSEIRDGHIKQAIEDFTVGGLSTVGELLDMVKAGTIDRPRGLAYSTIQTLAYGIPALATGAVGALLAPAVLPGAIGAGAAAGIGFAAGGFVGQVPTEIGAWISQRLQEKGFDLTNPDDIKKAYSDPNLMATVRAEAERKGITTASVDALANAFAGRLLAKPGTSILSKIGRGVAEVGIQATGESTSELAGQVAAKKGFKGVDIGEVIQEGIGSLGFSFAEIGIGTLSRTRSLFSSDPIISVVEVSKKTDEAIKTQQNLEALSNISEAVKEVKTVTKVPEALKSLIDTITDETPQNIYFQTKDWDDYWQSQKLSPAQAAAQIMGDDGKSYYQSKVEGTSFEIPLSNYIDKVATTEHFNGLLETTRIQPDGMTLKESQDFLKELPAVMNEIASEATKKIDTPAIQEARAIGQNIATQLESAGFEKTTARTYSRLYESTFRTLADRTGLSPQALFDRFKLQIQRRETVEKGPLPIKESELKKSVETQVLQELEATPIFAFKKRLGNKSVFISPENWNDWKPVIDKIGQTYFTKSKEKGTKLHIDTFAQEFGELLIGRELSDKELFDLLDRAEVFTQERIKEEVTKRISDEDSISEFFRNKDIQKLIEGVTVEQIDDILNNEPRIKETVDLFNTIEPDLNVTQEELKNALNRLRISITHPSEAHSRPLQEFFQGEVTLFQNDSNFIDGRSSSGITLYHGTSKSNFSEISKTGILNGPVFLTPKKEVAGEYSGDGEVIEVNIPEKDIKIDLDLPGAKLLSVEEANDYLGNQDWTLDTYIENGYSVGTEKSIYLNQNKTQLNQGEVTPKGAFRFGDSEFNIDILKGANLSTFLHETGHFYFEILGRLAQDENAPQQIKDDYASLRKYVDSKEWATITREQHEKVAEAFEVYLREGKAPSISLRKAFANFRAWLLGLYRNIQGFPVLTKEVRGVFDRLIATDEEILAAQAEGEVIPIFLDAKEAGMTDEQFELYKQDVQEVSLKAQEEFQQQVLKEHNRATKKWWKDEEEKTRDQVTKEINDKKEYIALSLLQKGTMPDGSPAPEGVKTPKLAKQALVDVYGKDIIKSLPKGLYSSEGVDQDSAAELFGFTSGDELVKALISLKDKNKTIDGITNARMIVEHGDMLIDGRAAEVARLAVNNEGRSAVMLAELRALRKRQKEVAPILKGKEKEIRAGLAQIKETVPSLNLIRQAAETTIRETKVRNLAPYKYFVASRQASREVLSAFAKGDYKTAADFQEKALFSNELYRAAVKAKTESDKIVTYANSFLKPKTRERIGKAGKSYLDQIDSFLDRFDFTRGLSLSRIDKRTSLADWIKSQEDQGLVPVIPPNLRNEAFREHYKNLSYEDLIGIKDSLKNIEHFASLKNKLLTSVKKRNLEETVDYGVAGIIKESKGKKKQQIETRLPSQEAKRVVTGFLAHSRKFDSLIREMDGFKDNGPMWEIFSLPQNIAADKEVQANIEASQKLDKIFSTYTKTERFNLYRKKHFPEIQDSLSKTAQLLIALNWGNVGNRTKFMAGRKLRDGRNWDETQVKAVLDNLTKKDWDFVESIWRLLESYWPETKAISERVNGVAPEKVEAAPVQTKFGIIEGSYFPLKYDRELSRKVFETEIIANLEDSLRGGTIRATTKHGYREERVEGVELPVRLDFGVIFEHLSEVIHDQTHYEYLLDANKLLRNQRMQETIIEHYGLQVYQELTNLLKDLAIGNRGAQESFEKFTNYLRNGLTISILAFRATTALIQPTGLTNSISRVGPKWVAKGVEKWLGDTAKLELVTKMIYEKSIFMRNRWAALNREIADIRNKAKARGIILGPIEDSYFYFIQKMQLVADIPTWLGAYEKAMATLPNDFTAQEREARAVHLADQAVADAQGGGRLKDLAGIQRGSAYKKLFINFFSFFSSTYQLIVEAVKKRKLRISNFLSLQTPLEIGRLAADMALLVSIPSMMGTALSTAIAGGDDEDEFIKRAAEDQVFYLMGMMVGLREIGSAIQGYRGYEGPAGTRFYSEAGRLAKQVMQGEVDEALLRSLNKTGGILFHYPASQLDATLRGFLAYNEGKTDNPAAILFGPPRK
jgi:hypothetical protein